jgi:hypothetical protein
MFKLNHFPESKLKFDKKNRNNNTKYNKIKYLLIGTVILLSSIGIYFSILETPSKEKQLLQKYINKEPLTINEKLELCTWLDGNESYKKEFEEICGDKAERPEYTKVKKYVEDNSGGDSKLQKDSVVLAFKENLKDILASRTPYQKEYIYLTAYNYYKHLKKLYPDQILYRDTKNGYRVYFSLERFFHIVIKHDLYKKKFDFTNRKNISQFKDGDFIRTEQHVFEDVYRIFDHINQNNESKFLERKVPNSEIQNNELYYQYLNNNKILQNYVLNYKIKNKIIYVQTYYEIEDSVINNAINRYKLIKEILDSTQISNKHFIYRLDK